ncbi:unnamed protein product [Ranitomeya imitator]|uniref:G-protein coupled receptors family 1 profile domain-containing protein n=1 Tax=Ranitomeya imitator TaxID=111125 RepID=A0ABN9L573_9NEOB|nr:unnamed protein product [Ranitomeya imitator]
MDDAQENLTYRCIFDEDFKYILLPVSYGIVFAFGFILNVLALYIFIFRIRPWKVVNIFMFNLALSDLLYVLSLPFLAYYYSKANDWPFSEAFCKIVRFLFYTSLYCSILFLLCISIYRFLAVCYPLRFLQWGKNPMSDNSTVCHDTSKIELFDQFVIYSTVNLSILFFCVPFTILIISYCYMIYVLIQPMESSTQTAESKKKSIKMIITVMLVFIISFLPFHVTRTFVLLLS